MPDEIVTSKLHLNLKSSEKAVEDISEKGPDVKTALQRSLNGLKLIQYVDLPKEWRNNRFVHRGYRFIPIDKWPLIILSLFALHNQTCKQFPSFYHDGDLKRARSSEHPYPSYTRDDLAP